MRWPARRRLAAWYLVALGLVTMALAVGGWQLLRESMIDAADTHLAGRLDGVSRFIDAVQQELPREEVLDEFREYAQLTPGDALLEVADEAGTVYCKPALPGWDALHAHGASWPGSAEPDRPVFSDHTLDNRPFRVVEATVRVHDKRFHVVAALPMAPFDAAVSRFGWLLSGLVPLVLALSAAGGYWISRRALRPVDRMTRAVQAISVDHLDRRLDVPSDDPDLARLAQTFNGMLARLEAAVADMKRLTAEAAHELRTPVALLRATAEVAVARDRPAADYRQALSDMLEQTERMSALVNDLVTLARADAGVEPWDAAAVDVGSVAADAARSVRATMERQSLAFDVEASDRPIEVTGSAQSLRRLVLILLDNAIKYTPAGGAVRLRVAAEGPDAVIDVGDTGIGVDPVERARVFDRFFRGAAARARVPDGTGLGLSIARAIAERHGGSIELQDAPGGAGALARVRLPGALQ